MPQETLLDNKINIYLISKHFFHVNINNMRDIVTLQLYLVSYLHKMQFMAIQVKIKFRLKILTHHRLILDFLCLQALIINELVLGDNGK